MKSFVSFFLMIATLAAPALRGEELPLTLDECIARARSLSVDAAVARNELRTSYWEYRSYRADRLPEISFKASLPTYRKQYSSYMNDAGEYSFVRNNYLQMTGQLSLSQTVTATGGTIAVNTDLDFLRQLDGVRYNRFMSI
ncbi:MAG: TolC family protein, partial [Paramuribaculum sp.]|nr:TolC family protein [Paramuribaculum sp.]